VQVQPQPSTQQSTSQSVSSFNWKTVLYYGLGIAVAVGGAMAVKKQLKKRKAAKQSA
jgi:hypothetical protein